MLRDRFGLRPWEFRRLTLWDVEDLMRQIADERAPAVAAHTPQASPVNVTAFAAERRADVFRRAANRAGVTPAGFAAQDDAAIVAAVQAVTGTAYPPDKLAAAVQAWAKGE